MSDTSPTRQAIAAVNRSYPGKVTGRLRGALLDMVWKGSRRDDAALANRMSVHGLREALKRPHVKAFYLGELGVLRESERPRTFHRLCDLRDQDENRNAAVAAARTLEQLSDAEQARSNAANHPTPGVCIVIRTAEPTAPIVDVVAFSPPSQLQPAKPLPAIDSEPIFKLD